LIIAIELNTIFTISTMYITLVSHLSSSSSILSDGAHDRNHWNSSG
jgi:hypothetical protein